MGLKLFGGSASTALVFGAALTALVNNDTTSAEQVDAANQELATAGITGAQLVPGATLEELTAKADRVDTAEQAATAANEKLTDLEAKNTQLSQDLAAEKKRADELAKTPGAEHTAAVRKPGESDLADEPSDAEASQKLVDELHAKMLG